MLIINSRKKLIFAYFYTYLFLLSSTIFLPGRGIYISAVYLISLFGFISFSSYKNSFSYKGIWIILIATSVFLIQSILFHTFPTNSFIRFLMMWSLPFLLVRILGINYIKYLISIVYVISIISFALLIPSYIIPNFHDFIGTIAPKLGTDIYLVNQNFIIFTWEPNLNGLIRNSGNFNEPGYFGGILTFCLGFNLQFEKISSKKNLIFILAMLSTFSTGTYLCLFILLYGVYLSKEKKLFLKILAVPTLIVISYLAYSSLGFMQNKIETQYESQIEGDLNRGRLGTFRIDLQTTIDNPITGRGLVKGTRFDTNEYNNEFIPSMNSLSGMFAKYGLIVTPIMLYVIFLSLSRLSKYYKFSKWYKYFLFVALLMSSFSQPMLYIPTYMSLYFIPKLPRNFRF